MSNWSIENDEILTFMTYDHLDERLWHVSKQICELARALNANSDLADCPDKTVGLRKLLEAKDCFVRATIRKGI
jgi:hypothetical protein